MSSVASCVRFCEHLFKEAEASRLRRLEGGRAPCSQKRTQLAAGKNTKDFLDSCLHRNDNDVI